MMFAAAAAASVIRRCAAYHPSFRGFVSSTLNGGGSKGAGVPWLLFSSRDNRESLYLYKLTKDDKYGRNNVELHRELSLPEIAGHDFIGSSHGLLFTMPFTKHSIEIRAINPLTGEEPLRLPPCDAILGQELISDQHVRLHHVFSEAKAIISPSCDTVLLLIPFHALGLNFARLDPAPPPSWTPLPMRAVDDFIFHKGRLHVVDAKGDLAVSDDDKDFSSVSVVCCSDIDLSDSQNKHHVTRMCLVESPNGDDLFLLIREWAWYFDGYQTFSFRVFKLHYDKNGGGGGGGGSGCCRWKEVDSLGDVAMFVGPNRAVSLCASDFPDLKSNAIYFTDYDKWFDAGVFYLEDESVIFFDIPESDESFCRPPPIWLETAAACGAESA